MKIAEDANTLADRLYIRICMARIKITLPTHVDFSTEIALRIGDINYGGHLGNDAVLALVHEARVQLFVSQGSASSLPMPPWYTRRKHFMATVCG